MAARDIVPKEKEEALIASVDILTLFTDTWQQFVEFVHANKEYVLDPRIRERLIKGVDRDAALALVVMSESLTDDIQKEIVTHDEQALRTRLNRIICIGDVDIPPDALERAFVFGELFCLCVNNLNS